MERRNFHWDEFLESGATGMGLLVASNFDFKTLAMREITKYSKSTMVSLASQLAEGIKALSTI